MSIVPFTLGVIAVILYVVTLISTNKKTILVFLILSNIFYGLQYLMLNAYSGVYVCLIAIFRTLVYLKYEKSNRKIDTFPIIVFVCITIFSGIMSYNGIVSLLPIIGTCVYTVYLSGEDIKKFKYACIISSSSWLLYNIFVKAYAGIISSIIEIITVVYSLTKLKSNRFTKK